MAARLSDLTQLRAKLDATTLPLYLGGEIAPESTPLHIRIFSDSCSVPSLYFQGRHDVFQFHFPCTRQELEF